MNILKRIAFMIPLLLLISVLAFILMKLTPGGPFDKERKPASPAIERNIAKKFHLDDPSWKQYLRYLGLLWVTDKDTGRLHRVEGGLIVGDLGPSTKYRDHSINDIILQHLPVSMMLGLCAFLFAQGIGIPLGFYTAVRRGQWGDYAGSFFAVLSFCIPALVVGPLLVMAFAIKMHLFPPSLWGTPLHLILPTVALGLYFAGRLSRIMREGVTQTLQEPFVMAARARGLSETAVLCKHVLRVAILPVVSYSGPLLADLLTGSFVVEAIFQIPGVGVFLVNGVLNKDIAMTIGLVLVYAVLLLVLNLLVDVAYSMLDRRVKAV